MIPCSWLWRNLPLVRTRDVLGFVLVMTASLVWFAGVVEARDPQGTRGGEAALKQAVLAAEDARASTPDDLKPLLEGLRSTSPDIQRLAVRALGRLERPALVPNIVPLLSAPSPIVRAEAATALGQVVQVQGPPPPPPVDLAGVVTPLKERLKSESDPDVKRCIYASLGRLPFNTPAEVRDVEAVLVDGTRDGEKDATFEVLLGTTEGLETLFRQQVKKGTALPASIERLRQLVRAAKAPATAKPEVQEAAARVRRLCLGALAAMGQADADTIRAAQTDRDDQVRRMATVAAGSAEAMQRNGWAPPADAPALAAVDRAALIATALRDPAGMVRFDGIKAYSTHLQATGCGPLLDATKDKSPHVVLRAIDLLAGKCPDAEKAPVTAALVALAKQLPDGKAPGRIAWHAPAHALTTLATVAPDQVTALLPGFASHPLWLVRVYAARAAGTLADAATLQTLANDSHHNVRAAAIMGLSRVKKHEADAAYIDALAATDHNLIAQAARALDGTTDKAKALPALLATLKRLTDAKIENTRDARVRILEVVAKLGGPEQAADLTPLLSDYDPRVATRVADMLTRWTGSAKQAAPTLLPVPPPTVADLDRLVGAKAVVTMRGLGSFEIALAPWEAPATVNRFVKLAQASYYNGLTFHRVEPNWVIQGGSPGANELKGDAMFWRDEVGRLPHARGALGISTRGRDTGDGQMYVDLTDNFRLDHNYTVFGKVTRGMDVVDAVIEGDIIDKIEIVVAPVTKSH